MDGTSDSLSIGEMLDLLKVEFPDVTISKIRFLESQGLLDPERTASGYRKFYQADVERLRWILQQQRENFLPLKVIKDRLEAESGEPVHPTPAPSPEAAAAGPAASPSPGDEQPPGQAEPAPAQRAKVSGDRSSSRPHQGTSEGDPNSAIFTRDELARNSGLSAADLVQLERHGLLIGSAVSGQLYYDGEALEVARYAADFARHGVEPRHLRMYKNAAEREAGFYEQVVLPLLKQRNPAARRQAMETLDELARLGRSLHAALLRRALRSVGTEPTAPSKGGRRGS